MSAPISPVTEIFVNKDKAYAAVPHTRILLSKNPLPDAVAWEIIYTVPKPVTG